MRYLFEKIPLLLCLLAALGCGAGQSNLREPRLTNPDRHARWLGDEASPPAESGGVGQPEVDPYEGAFRLPLDEEWTWELPDDGEWALARLELGTPAVSARQVFVGSSRSSGLYVLDRRTGRRMARLETEGPVQAPLTPVETGGWILVDSFGVVQRLDEGLEPVWSQPYRLGAGVSRSAVVDRDRVYLASSSDTVVALNLADGEWRWTYRREVARTAQELAILGGPAPVVAGEEVIVGFSDGSVAGLAASSGAINWSVPIGEGKFPDIEAEPVLVGDDLIVAASFGGPMVGIDRMTHRIRWVNKDAGAVGTMEYAGGSVYTSDASGRVLCVDARTGETVWAFEHKSAQFAAPVRAGGSILVGDVAGSLYALDRFDGTRQWRFEPRSGLRLAGVATRPAVYGRQVLIPSAGGVLYALIANSGAEPDQSEAPAHRPDRTIGW